MQTKLRGTKVKIASNLDYFSSCFSVSPALNFLKNVKSKSVMITLNPQIIFLLFKFNFTLKTLVLVLWWIKIVCHLSHFGTDVALIYS